MCTYFHDFGDTVFHRVLFSRFNLNIEKVKEGIKFCRLSVLLLKFWINWNKQNAFNFFLCKSSDSDERDS